MPDSQVHVWHEHSRLGQRLPAAAQEKSSLVSAITLHPGLRPRASRSPLSTRTTRNVARAPEGQTSVVDHVVRCSVKCLPKRLALASHPGVVHNGFRSLYIGRAFVWRLRVLVVSR